MTTQIKVWDKEAIQTLLETNAGALAKAVLTIYARQTAGEQSAKTTTEANSRGFSAFDAEFLSDIAQKLPRYGNRMTTAQRSRVLPKMKRYWKQLLEEIEAKGGVVSYKPTSSSASKSLNREIVPPAAHRERVVRGQFA